MQFDALIPGILVRRFKRFFADVQLSTGDVVTAYCPNTGVMLGVTEPGLPVWIQHTPSPRRRLAYTWHMVEAEGTYVGVNTMMPQTIVREALAQKQLSPFLDYTQIREEVPYGQRSRVDFLLTTPDHPPCYLELKNVHLKRGHTACFPDTPTTRGVKHLKDLAAQAQQGHRALVMYVVQRRDCTHFQVAHDIDPDYAQASLLAQQAGVEFLSYGCHISPSGIELQAHQPLPCLPPFL